MAFYFVFAVLNVAAGKAPMQVSNPLTTTRLFLAIAVIRKFAIY